MTESTTETNISKQLLDYFKNEFPDQDTKLVQDTNLLEEWLIDSLSIVNTTLFLEQTFGITIGRADINARNFRSVETLTQFVLDKLQKNQ